ncbi:MAG: hypothetical protein HQK51_09310 [Oligoflexia bacterium]|nr:hypothetical protein [Oligoflexia bacterium]
MIIGLFTPEISWPAFIHEDKKHYLFDEKSSLDDICITFGYKKGISKRLTDTFFIPDGKDVFNQYLLDSKAGISKKVKAKNKIDKVVCAINDNDNNNETPISTRYSKIEFDEGKALSATIYNPKFRYNRSIYFFSIENDLDAICEHYGFAKYNKSKKDSMVADTYFIMNPFASEVAKIDSKTKKFTGKQSGRQVAHIEKISCLK